MTTQTTVVTEPKNVFIAFLLTFFFGPLGMFYSTIGGAILMTILAVVVGMVTLGAGLFIIWPISVLWGVIACDRKIRTETTVPDKL
jgi:putative Ca2+/H+ antiporter (TMEM165/GDT1 family)